jgi:acetylornithine/succinyldiaminopimelate/putrescine aminotransferase
MFKNDIEPSPRGGHHHRAGAGRRRLLRGPAEFMQRLRALCDQHGILLIADEVQTGAGRTGTFFAIEQWAWRRPDHHGQVAGGGFPISAWSAAPR